MNGKLHSVLATLIACCCCCCLPWIATAQSVPELAELRWRNGDVLPGRLLESQSNKILWSSDLFLDEMEISTSVLDSIRFTTSGAQKEGEFKVETVYGDRFTADLSAADATGFSFNHPRFGAVQIKRDAISALTRVDSKQLIFDGSGITEWNAMADGPIKDLKFKTYQGSWQWSEDFPELFKLRPQREGSYRRGFIQTELGGVATKFAMVFTGFIDVKQSGVHTFQLRADDRARLFLNQELVIEVNGNRSGVITDSTFLQAGEYAVRLEFLNYGGAAYAEASWTNPDGIRTALSGDNINVGWHSSADLTPNTDENQAELSRSLDLPDQYEILLNLSSSEIPTFVFTVGEQNQGFGFRSTWTLETWDDELIFMKDEIFESILTMDKNQKNLRLRFLVDKSTRQLVIADHERRVIRRLTNVEAATGGSLVRLRNRGRDLSLHQLSIFRRNFPDLDRIDKGHFPLLFMSDGALMEGDLYFENGSASTVASATETEGVEGVEGIEEVSQPIEIKDLDRLELNSQAPKPADHSALLVYKDGSIIRGNLIQSNEEDIQLETAFSNEFIHCKFEGLSIFHFNDSNPSAGAVDEKDPRLDVLKSSLGAVHGELVFGFEETPLQWKSLGSESTVRLASREGVRIERGDKQGTPDPGYDQEIYPSVVHLENGETIPCSIQSWTPTELNVKSPFLSGNQIPSDAIRALVFNASFAPVKWDERKMQRTLTVPRFSRGNPPTHILSAKNGDVMRGRLLGIQGASLQFQSKLQNFNIPIERLVQCVRVELPTENNQPSALFQIEERHGKVRAELTDGSVFEFMAREIEKALIRGSSDLYGALSIPIESVQELTIGDFENWRHKKSFQQWTLQPAREPDFGIDDDDDVNTSGNRKSNGLTTPDRKSSGNSSTEVPVKVDPAEAESKDIAEEASAKLTALQDTSSATSTQRSSSAELGKVVINAADRTLRFPVSINQREGLVEYMLVTHEGKTHESVFKTDAQALHIHLGLLLLGGKPDYITQLSSDPDAIPPGDPIDIELTWNQNGESHSRRLGTFAITRNNSESLAPGPWHYNGSIVTSEGILAESVGSIISLRLDPEAILNNPRPGRLNDDLHYVNTTALPEVFEDMLMVFKVGK